MKKFTYITGNYRMVNNKIKEMTGGHYSGKSPICTRKGNCFFKVDGKMYDIYFHIDNRLTDNNFSIVERD